MMDEERIHKAVIAQSVDLVTKKYWEIPWRIYAQMFELPVEEFYLNPDRFWRSQYFHDDDYPTHVLAYLNNCYEYSKELTLSMIRKIIDNMTEEKIIDEEYLKDKYPLLFSFKHAKEISHGIRFIPPTTEKFIDIESAPDDFYRELIRKINISYQVGLYSCTLVLLRKLIENLLIDILRYTFGFQQIELFYDKDHGRFKALSELIKNFKKYKDKYKTTVREIDVLIERIEELRPYTNASAHSIEDELKVTKRELDELNDKINLNYIIASLIRINNSLNK